MTNTQKPIWIVIFRDNERTELRTQRIAAYDLPEALTYFNGIAHKTIVEIKKTDDIITFQY